MEDESAREKSRGAVVCTIHVAFPHGRYLPEIGWAPGRRTTDLQATARRSLFYFYYHLLSSYTLRDASHARICLWYAFIQLLKYYF